MTKPIIGIPGNLILNNCIERNFVNKKYTDAVFQNGGIPVIIPYSDNFEDYGSVLDMCGAFLITGGEDVDPSLYMEGPNEHLGEIKPWHDKFVLSILSYAEKNNKFCLGICRGLQLIAVYSGGSLYQDIYSQREEETFLHFQKGRRDYIIHPVEIEKDSYLASVIGETSIGVNSMHHQSVKKLRKTFEISAYSPDGIVEAIESRDRLFLGVQWHPEELFEKHEVMARLFRELARRAAERLSLLNMSAVHSPEYSLGKPNARYGQ